MTTNIVNVGRQWWSCEAPDRGVQRVFPPALLGCYSFARVRDVWGINRVLLHISIWFSCHVAGFYVTNRAVTRLLLLRKCMNYELFGVFFVANTVAHVHRQLVKQDTINCVFDSLQRIIRTLTRRHVQCELKKQDTRLVSITSWNIKRFSKFFHC